MIVSRLKRSPASARSAALRLAAWISAAPDLSTISTRRMFALWQGAETNKALQSAWNLHGPESFAFRVLEEIDLEQPTYGRERALKERVQHWREVVGAEGI